VKGDSILVRSGQAWKFKLSMFFVLLGVAGMAVSHGMARSESDIWRVVNLASVAAGFLGGFLFPSLSIRCPKCRERWFVMAISSKRHDEWFLWLLDAKVCPSCEATGEP